MVASSLSFEVNWDIDDLFAQAVSWLSTPGPQDKSYPGLLSAPQFSDLVVGVFGPEFVQSFRLMLWSFGLFQSQRLGIPPGSSSEFQNILESLGTRAGSAFIVALDKVLG